MQNKFVLLETPDLTDLQNISVRWIQDHEKGMSYYEVSGMGMTMRGTVFVQTVKDTEENKIKLKQYMKLFDKHQIEFMEELIEKKIKNALYYEKNE